MRTFLTSSLTTMISTGTLASVASVAILGAGCFGEVGTEDRKPGRGSGSGASTEEPRSDSSPCEKLDKDVTIRSMADMAALPESGCYDIYGKLIVSGSAITSLAGLHAINSVDELQLDHTNLTTIDTAAPIGLYGKLVVTSNAKLTSLENLTFETAATGVVIEANPLLATLEPLGLAAPKLEQINGDLAITNNAALPAISIPYLTKVTGAVAITNNAAAKSVDLGRLATTGRVDLTDHPKLTSLNLAVSQVNGDLTIRNNAALVTLGTMSALYRVTGNLTIDNNAALTNLTTFTGVRFVDRVLAITSNQNLTDLGALKRTQLIGAITITNNRNLLICRAIEIDECVPHPTAADIRGNRDVECNWQCN